MRKSMNNILHFTIQGEEGELGKLKDCYFDDEQWTIRYFVVHTGSWLTGRDVLISPIAMKHVDWEIKCIDVNLDRQSIADSPDILSARIVSRKKEEELSRHYRWPLYWNGIGIWGRGMAPTFLAYEEFSEPEEVREKRNSGECHLRSVDEVTGYHIEASDGEIGHVEDFLLDENTWKILYLIIDTKNWLPGKNVLIDLLSLDYFSWEEQKAYIELARDQVLEAIQIS